MYDGTALSSAALPLAALFPAIDLKIWAIVLNIAGFAMVWVGKYEAFFFKRSRQRWLASCWLLGLAWRLLHYKT